MNYSRMCTTSRVFRLNRITCNNRTLILICTGALIGSSFFLLLAMDGQFWSLSPSPPRCFLLSSTPQLDIVSNRTNALTILEDNYREEQKPNVTSDPDFPPAILPNVGPFSNEFVNFLSFNKGNPVVKCNGGLIRVEPWVKVVDGNRIVFSVPPEVEGDVLCSIHELKVWPSGPKGSDEPSFWPAKRMFRWSKRGNSTLTASHGQLSDMKTSLQLEKSDFAAVECSSSLNGVSRRKKWSGAITGIHKAERFKEATFNNTSSGSQKPPNVLIIIVDAVSRFAAENALPLTMDYLRRELGAAIFEHQTIVGENSLPNAIAFLAGQRLEDMPWSRKGALVEYPMIWKHFSTKGYVTAYMEDWPTTFRDNAKSYFGTQPPTDHIGYMFAHFTYKRKRRNCVLGQPSHEFLMNLPEAMWTIYPKTQPKFYVGWFNEYSHGEVWKAAYLDTPLTVLLQAMRIKGFLDDTITIIMGDHGNRFMQKLRTTTGGRLDHRTPLLAIVPPLMNKQNGELSWQTLRSNTNKLTSHFDLHATLWDILRNAPGKPIPQDQKFFTGRSLFTPIPEQRSCKDAGIPTFFCPYVDWTSNALSPRLLSSLGEKFVLFVNEYQREYFKAYGVEDVPCKNRTLWRTQNGGILEEGRFFLVLFVAGGPHSAEFEISGTYKGDFEDVQFLVHDMARMDKFGDPLYCLRKFPESPQQKIMELFCVCVKDSDGPKTLPTRISFS